MENLKLFLFYSDVEEHLVIAENKGDAFEVVRSVFKYNDAQLDELILDHLSEYPKNSVISRSGQTAGQFIKKVGKKDAWHGEVGEFIRPKESA